MSAAALTMRPILAIASMKIIADVDRVIGLFYLSQRFSPASKIAPPTLLTCFHNEGGMRQQDRSV
jgi:hypothetical protein